jgi:hypothetical protein
LIVTVDVTVNPPQIALDEPDDLARFHVGIKGNNEARAKRLLASTGTGALVGRDVAVIGVDAVRRMAAGQVDAQWADRFAAMLDFADSQGWLIDDGAGIRAHCEWT